MLKKKFLLVPALIIFGLFFLISCQEENSHENNWQPSYLAHLELGSTTLVATAVAENMEVPWEVTWGPDDKLWFTEQNGSVYRMDVESGERKKVLQVPDIHYQKSRGLLGMALHPELPEEPYVFLHYTYLKSDDVLDKEIESRVVRYTLERDTLVSPKILLDEIPGQTYHNGSRLLISPDEKLFFAMGDAGFIPESAQSLNASITIAALIVGVSQLFFLYNVYWSLRHGKKAERDPWGAASLEWQTPDVPPHHGNWGPELPRVYRWAYDYSVPGTEKDFIPQNEPLDDRERTAGR